MFCVQVEDAHVVLQQNMDVSVEHHPLEPYSLSENVFGYSIENGGDNLGQNGTYRMEEPLCMVPGHSVHQRVGDLQVAGAATIQQNSPSNVVDVRHYP